MHVLACVGKLQGSSESIRASNWKELFKVFTHILRLFLIIVCVYFV